MGDESSLPRVPWENPSRNSSGATRLGNGRLKDEYYECIPPDFFAPRLGDKTLDVGIVGAGIAGLAAAIALVQAGHDVEVSQDPDVCSIGMLSDSLRFSKGRNLRMR
jgi:hypothetical protein